MPVNQANYVKGRQMKKAFAKQMILANLVTKHKNYQTSLNRQL